MVTVFVILAIWVLLNILFVLIVIPPRKPQSRPSISGTALSPEPIDKNPGQVGQDQPPSLRHAVMSVAMGAFFVLVPLLIALRNTIARLLKKAP